MKMISQQMIFGREVLNIATGTNRYPTQPVSGVLGSGKQPVPLLYNQLTDLESVRLMEERYGIKEEGVF